MSEGKKYEDDEGLPKPPKGREALHILATANNLPSPEVCQKCGKQLDATDYYDYWCNQCL